MASVDSSSKSSILEKNLLQGLGLDMSVLEMLLERHRSGHGRTKYFQRCSMVLQALYRYSLEDSLGSHCNDLQRSITKLVHDEQKRKKRKQDEWVIGGRHQDQITEAQQLLLDQLASVHRSILNHIPEVMSRIIHAAQSLSVEVSRGFFLPFCTVTLGVLARIRVILMQLGQSVLANRLPNVHKEIMTAIFSKRQMRAVIEACPLVSGAIEDGSHNLDGPTMGQVFEALVEPSVLAGTTKSDRDRTIDTLKQLGIISDTYTRSKQSTSATETETSSIIPMQQDHDADADEGRIRGDEDVQKLVSTTNNAEQLEGASLLIDQDADEDIGVGAIGGDSHQFEEGKPGAAMGTEPIDKNDKLVELLKTQQKAKPSKRKSTSGTDEGKKDKKKAKKNKKKKKDKAQGDFFDSLFG